MLEEESVTSVERLDAHTHPKIHLGPEESVEGASLVRCSEIVTQRRKLSVRVPAEFFVPHIPVFKAAAKGNRKDRFQSSMGDNPRLLTATVGDDRVEGRGGEAVCSREYTVVKKYHPRPLNVFFQRIDFGA